MRGGGAGRWRGAERRRGPKGAEGGELGAPKLQGRTPSSAGLDLDACGGPSDGGGAEVVAVDGERRG